MSNVVFSLAPYHLMLYGGLFGTTVYQSFFAGITAYKVLPLQMFGKLQDRIFPGYFAIQSAASAALLVTSPFTLTSVNATILAISLASSLFNLLVIMPRAHEIKNLREAQMATEGKNYKDETASDEMKLLNKRFMKWHGVSMLSNLVGLISQVAYGFFFAAHISI